MQGFCPDTEEVTGSNPVSPTSAIPGQTQFEDIASDVEQHMRKSDTNGIVVRIVWPMRQRSPPAGYNDVASTALRLLAGALRDSPGSREQSAVNAWLGRADRRYSRTFAPPPPGRPAFTTLRSSGQWVHVHRTNIAPFGRQEEVAGGGLGPHFVVWLKQTSVRAAFQGVSIVSSKLFPSILT
jgi:hypothetical protein